MLGLLQLYLSAAPSRAAPSVAVSQDQLALRA